MISKNVDRAIAACISVLLLSSCASTSLGSEIDWGNGAKRGWIVSFYRSDLATADLPPCLAKLPTNEFATRHFVKVEYRYVRQMHTRVAEIPETLHAKVNDEVELWPEECAKGKISRITKIIHPAPQ